MAHRTLFTIGHSTHPWPEFVRLLQTWDVAELVDVRLLPRSRTFPWFNKDRLARALPRSNIAYTHLQALGGLRRPSKDSPNTGWQNARFRAYADYMQTPDFAAALAQLDAKRRTHRVCIMCSESVWWRCHRRMIADAFVARGVPVRHIMSPTSAPRHELTDFAVITRITKTRPLITYPGPAE